MKIHNRTASMRGFMLSAVLLVAACSPAYAAQRSSSPCWPGGPFQQTTQHATQCPPKLELAFVQSIGTTSYTVYATTDKSSGTLYYYTSTSPNPPTMKGFRSGLGNAGNCQPVGGGATSCAVTVTASGNQGRMIAGLTSGIQYYTHVVHERNNRPSYFRTFPVRTLDPGGPPTTLSGIFVGTGGCTVYGATQVVDGTSVTCNGTAHSRRFANYSLLNDVPEVIGTDVWSLTGSVHNATEYGAVRTLWGGSSGNPSVWGCYYLDGSTPTACTAGSNGGSLNNKTAPKTVNAMGAGLVLPQINGALSQACIDALNCNWNFPIANECPNAHQALFLVAHAHIHVDGLHVTESTCRNITVNPPNGAGEGIRFTNSISSNSGYQLMVVQGGTQYGVAHRNVFRGAGKCYTHRNYGGTRPGNPDPAVSANCGGTVGHSGGAVVSGILNAWWGWSDNTMTSSYSEGLQCLSSSRVWFKGNRVGSTAHAPIYLDTCQDSVVESNVLWSTQGDVGQPPGRNFTSDTLAQRLIIEKTQVDKPVQATGIVVRNNVYVVMGSGIKVAVQPEAADPAKGKQVGARFLHNTIIGALQYHIDVFQNLTTALITQMDVRNNIFTSPIGSAVSRCFADADAVYDYNLYGFSGIPAECKGANDKNSSNATNPNLVLNPYQNATNEALWSSHDGSNLPNFENARVTSGANTGVDLTATVCKDDAVATEYAKIAHLMTYPYGLDANSDGSVVLSEMADWKQCAKLDFMGNVRAATPDLGAFEFGGAL